MSETKKGERFKVINNEGTHFQIGDEVTYFDKGFNKWWSHYADKKGHCQLMHKRQVEKIGKMKLVKLGLNKN